MRVMLALLTPIIFSGCCGPRTYTTFTAPDRPYFESLTVAELAELKDQEKTGGVLENVLSKFDTNLTSAQGYIKKVDKRVSIANDEG